MKTAVSKSLLMATWVAFVPTGLDAQATTAQPPPSPPGSETVTLTQAQLDWQDLQESRKQVERDGKDQKRADLREVRIAGNKGLAAKARTFYSSHAADPQAAEARKLEVFSLINALEDGDETSAPRLTQAVAELRSQPQISPQAKAQGVAAYEYTRAIRGVFAPDERMKKTEAVARELIKEFPGEPQGFEGLWAVARASEPTVSEKLARELLVSAAPEAIKKGAQALLNRYALVGKPLASVLADSALAALAKLPANTPILVYSWATWGPGSLEFGRMVQARRFAALGLCLDDDPEAAAKTAHSLGLGGGLLYDKGGLEGQLARRLNFTTAGQIYLVDETGVIRDVRGGEDLENKLTALGFRTPPINPTAKELRP